MTSMYAARLARFDLLRAVAGLSQFLTKWGEIEDAKLLRLMSYIWHTCDQELVGFVGDPPEALELFLYSDADFASDKSDFKSTSGVFLVLVGPHTFYPLTALSKKQTAISHRNQPFDRGS